MIFLDSSYLIGLIIDNDEITRKLTNYDQF